jgi:hypothetical protein
LDVITAWNAATATLVSMSQVPTAMGLANSIASEAVDKTDLLVGLTFVGAALGAGIWIGLEVTRFLMTIVRSAGSLARQRMLHSKPGAPPPASPRGDETRRAAR